MKILWQHIEQTQNFELGIGNESFYNDVTQHHNSDVQRKNTTKYNTALKIQTDCWEMPSCSDISGFSVFACLSKNTHTKTGACTQSDIQARKWAGRKMVVIIVSSLWLTAWHTHTHCCDALCCVAQNGGVWVPDAVPEWDGNESGQRRMGGLG